jgi:cell division protein FtsB
MLYDDELASNIKVKDQVLPRDETPRGESRIRRRAWIFGTGIAFVALVVGSIVGDRGFLNLRQKRMRVEGLRQEIGALRTENAHLAGEVSALRTSPEAIEKVAREQLGLARPDETVFLLREDDGSARP